MAQVYHLLVHFIPSFSYLTSLEARLYSWIDLNSYKQSLNTFLLKVLVAVSGRYTTTHSVEVVFFNSYLAQRK